MKCVGNELDTHILDSHHEHVNPWRAHFFSLGILSSVAEHCHCIVPCLLVL